MNIQLISDWKTSFKYYVMWGLVLIAASPDIYNYLVSQGFIEAQQVPLVFNSTIKTLAAVSAIGRIIKQTKDAMVAGGLIPEDVSKEDSGDGSGPL